MIRTDHAHLYVSALTHPGMTGKNNEDSYGVSSFITSLDDTTPSLLAVVADGIGGHRAGEIAAEIAVDTISKYVSESNGRKPLEVLKSAVQAASQTILTQAEKDKDRLGMGATCAVAWVIEDRLYTASVGDSRIYLVRGRRIQQVTVDHSWVQEAIDKGLLTPHDARNHPNVHVIRRYLGSTKPPEVDFRLRLDGNEKDAKMRANQGLLLLPGDVVLLCSDGLTDLVADEEILSIVRASSDLDTAARVLVTQANARGGRDNITVVLMGFPQKWVHLQKKRSCLPWLVGGMLALLVMAALAFAAVWYYLQPGWLPRFPWPAATDTPPALAVTGTPEPAPTITPLVLPTPIKIGTPTP